jgi:Leucine-rich repeat (LRR) protein
MMDTTCSTIINAGVLSVGNDTTILNVDGLQYFKSLYVLTCIKTKITSLPKLSNNLNTLNCYQNKLTTLPILPATLVNLDCSFNQLTTLPSAIPLILNKLVCSNNNITSIGVLPVNVLTFHCQSNLLTSIANIPPSTSSFMCDSNQITSLPLLPSSLNTFSCSYNQLTSLPNNLSGTSLQNFNCSYNKLTSLPSLPDTLKTLNIEGNQIAQSLTLPKKLVTLNCRYNKLTAIIVTDSLVQDLWAEYNQLTSLTYPANAQFKTVKIHKNKINSLPQLKYISDDLVIGDNPNLYCLPISRFDCRNIVIDTTKIKCLPTFSYYTKIYSINGVDSLRYFNYPIDSFRRVYPVVCSPINNVNQCSSTPKAVGNIYYDVNSNNIKDVNEQYAGI